MTLNLPYRFLAYSKPESLNPFFNALFEQLSAAGGRFHGHDTWTFDTIIRIIAPKFQITTRESALTFLINICGIPEGHINFDYEDFVPGHLFPTRNIHLSRHAMSLVVSELLRQKNSLQADLASELLVNPDKLAPDKSREDFETELRYIFADYFFSHPGADCWELTRNVWMYIRGEQLRAEYADAMRKLRLVVMRHMKYEIDDDTIDREVCEYKARAEESFYEIESDEQKFRKQIKEKLQESFTDTCVEIFKQKTIFDVLFQKKGEPTFKEQYEKALIGFGYQMDRKNPNDPNEKPRWRRRGVTAPKFPGALFTPDLSFFMAWSVGKLCKFIMSERSTSSVRDKSLWLKQVTRNFFLALKDGLNTVNRERFDGQIDFLTSPKFINQHQYKEAHRVVTQVRFGTGKTVTDKRSGAKMKEMPGTADFWKYQTLLTEDDKFCVSFRLRAEAELKELHARYLQEPCLELTRQISAAEQKISNECMALYGYNFQAWVKVPITLNKNGEFVTRKIVMPAKAVKEFNPPLARPNSLNPKIKQLDIFHQTAQIERGHPVRSYSFTNNKNELITGFELDPGGIFETVNPLVATPPARRAKDGAPRLVRENFRLCNFLIESDTMPLHEQSKLADRLVSLGVINRVVFSGNKSLHMIITVRDEPDTIDEYKWLFFHLMTKFGLAERTWIPEKAKYKYTGCVDLSLCNPNRSTRRPDCFRTIERAAPDGTVVKSQIKQELRYESDNIFDIDWRPIYNHEMQQARIQQEYNISNSQISWMKGNRNIDGFMTNYAAKNLISLSFEKGSGHSTGIILIGAAKTAEFSNAEIDSWLAENCDRYSELIGGWRDLIKHQRIANGR
ncbi:MAG: hypothetical protein LBJ73_03630 [Rickettsiales bacterium]|nr:hypothetical protein [Rickettsiales bacterium]